MPDRIPYYAINEPYELFYRNGSTAYPVGAHTHNEAEIYLTLTELPDALISDKVSSIPRGTLILIPPFCVHQLYHEKDVCYERYIVNLDINWLERLLPGGQKLTECLKQSASPLIISLSEEQLSRLTGLLQKNLSAVPEKSIKSTAEFLFLLAELEAIVHNADVNSSSLPVRVTKSQRTVNDIIVYINEHLEENIALPDIEAHFFLNKDYLSRLFMKHTHISIGRYITIRRIARAQAYLQDGMTVAQVSEKMGFSSYAYFFKVFQKTVGMSPSRYRSTRAENT